MWIPTLAGIARMVPVRDGNTEVNVGAQWEIEAFTVPAGRVLAIDWVMLQVFSGTAPDELRISLQPDGASGPVRLTSEKTPGIDQAVYVTNTVWLEEAGVLHLRATQGGATTDMMWAFSGRLFDWVDVT